MIELIDIEKTYHSKKGVGTAAIKKISLKFDNNGIVFVVGKSGCGKSTLLNLIGALDSVDYGKILIDDKSVSEFSNKEITNYRNYDVGFVFQEYNLFENFSVYKNIELALDLQSETDKENKIKQVLHSVELDNYEDRIVNELSGGQKQRVAIARALVKDAKVILCDEPTGSLDSETGNTIFELLQKISKDTLVIVVTHDVESAYKFGDRVISLKDGEVIKDETLKSIDKNGKKEFQYNKKETKLNASLIKTEAKMGFSYLKQRPIRLSFTIFLSILCLLVIACSSLINNVKTDDLLVDSMIAYNTCYIPISKSLYFSFDNVNSKVNFEDKDVENIKNNLNPKRIDKLYGRYFKLYDNFLETSVPYSAYFSEHYYNNYWCEIDEDFIKDYHLSYVGKLPSNDNEIMISKYEAEQFQYRGYKYNDYSAEVKNINDMIGCFVNLSSYFEPFKIVGIVDTGLDEKRYSSLKDKDYIYAHYNLKNEFDEMLNKGNLHTAIFFKKGFFDANFDYLSDLMVESDRYTELLFESNPAEQQESYLCKSVSSFLPDPSLIYTSGDKVITSLKDNELIVPFLTICGDEYEFLRIVADAITAFANEHFDEIRVLFRQVTQKEQADVDDYISYIEHETFGWNVPDEKADNIFHPGMTCRYFELQNIKNAIENGVIDFTKYQNNVSIDTGYKDIVFDSYSIVGVTYPVRKNTDEKPYTYISKDLKEKIYDTLDYKGSLVNTLIIPAPQNKKELTKILNKVNKRNDEVRLRNDNSDVVDVYSNYSTYSFSSELHYHIDKTVSDLDFVAKTYLNYISIFLVIILILYINYYYVGLIFDKKKEIGVLQAMGASKKKIFTMFAFEALYIILILFGITLILFGIGIPFANYMLKVFDAALIPYLHFSFIQVAIILGICILTFALGIIVPIIKFMKQEPVELIKYEE